jgi:hypothetical protein
MDAETEFVFFFTRAFTIPEVADKLGISASQVIAHIEDGTLHAVNVGRGSVRRDLRVTDDDLDSFVNRRRVGPAPPAITAGRPGLKPPVPVAGGYAERRAARRAARKET